MAKGIGTSSGLPFLQNIAQNPATVAMKNPITGKIAQMAAPVSKWGEVGKMLGENLGGSTPQRPAAASLPPIDTSTSVQRGRTYQAPQKKDQTRTLLEELARMAK